MSTAEEESQEWRAGMKRLRVMEDILKLLCEVFEENDLKTRTLKTAIEKVQKRIEDSHEFYPTVLG